MHVWKFDVLITNILYANISRFSKLNAIVCNPLSGFTINNNYINYIILKFVYE